MEPDSPMITIAIPVYNAGRFLRAAVCSITNQTFTNWELLLIDDGSTDDALSQISDLVDDRVRIIKDGKNKGLAARLNEAIDLARGRFFVRMDQDDFSYPMRLAQQLDWMQQHPDIDLLAARAVDISVEDEFVRLHPYALSHEEICSRPWQGFLMPHPTWFGRTEWFRANRYASPAPYFCEDQELLLRSHAHSRFTTTPEILLAYRLRSSINLSKHFRTRWWLFVVQLKYFSTKRNYWFMVLSIGVLLIRLILDIWQIRRGLMRVGTTQECQLANAQLQALLIRSPQ